ncbi:MAG TPA: type II secretion system protein [Chthonomonas sp.]|uniref:type II secretion system protein n=1 Tax=Chthonomonas sp. TaxID=2282153 RepID=UPI002B4B644A|nr:type II secretion system protein [Chthonomonas sp.]HLI48965.1 type II secretion system protein [Chthonomonas sp.]
MKRSEGFTLIEILLVVAILAVLAGILLAVLGPVRERARQNTCVSNLHQIGIALTLYRQDWDGADATRGVPMTSAQLGLPVGVEGLRTFFFSYVKDLNLFRCPDAYPINDPNVLNRHNYGFECDWSSVPEPEVPEPQRFDQCVARRGEEVVLVTDVNHNDFWNPLKGTPQPSDRYEAAPYLTRPRWATQRVILLRLNNQVSNELVPIHALCVNGGCPPDYNGL